MSGYSRIPFGVCLSLCNCTGEDERLRSLHALMSVRGVDSDLISLILSIEDSRNLSLPAQLVELSPKGLVAALRLDKFDPPRALNESTVIMDFLEE